MDENEDIEVEFYEPEPAFIPEDSCVIGDLAEFLDKFNGDAVQYRSGGIYVLDRDSHKWGNVEDFGKPEPAKTKLSRVQ